ncbi:MAG TPA: Nif3-like dinuclear metal center hexameric protein [Nitrosomonas sp.]|nr:Nif3-like dinuclear metal center hexameric protein [Nitrosomonas sp.]HQX13529.1 Nif3-like dinuclear metal center hexameric protein [Nitrosomonas sp.]HRB32915.1 Nif3-like dinuclear metal center hexameric protein [Nitrosomonas sp.]HRB45576.1 Nif3-like dinuclear metal center hexameric protein [Nitrosomonas sp.]HRB77581.1 Nif3-like dinuclear metal center hexameric protein [Nitrosomonas sp.]
MHRDVLEKYLNELLDIHRFQDYCPNGLQVEGRHQVENIVSGVTASLDLLQAAIAAKADAILVHHGYFWRNEDSRIVGIKSRRIGLLMANQVNLFAYHLPLDSHPQFGNNTLLGKKLGFIETGRFGGQDIMMHGELPKKMTLKELEERISRTLLRKPQVIGDENKIIHRIAWCTGGAQNYFDAVIPQNVDAYITGEISEHNVHLARETGIAFISAGHHATERYGVQALGDHIAQKFSLQHQFIDMDNPV